MLLADGGWGMFPKQCTRAHTRKTLVLDGVSLVRHDVLLEDPHPIGPISPIMTTMEKTAILPYIKTNLEHNAMFPKGSVLTMSRVSVSQIPTLMGSIAKHKNRRHP